MTSPENPTGHESDQVGDESIDEAVSLDAELLETEAKFAADLMERLGVDSETIANDPDLSFKLGQLDYAKRVQEQLERLKKTDED